MELLITFEKETYSVGEQINCKIKLMNTTEETLLVNKRMALNGPHVPSPFREVCFKIVGSGGELFFGPRINIGGPGVEDFVALKPGTSLEKSYGLTFYYDFSKPDKYTIQATYDNQGVPENAKEGINIWRGKLESNIVEIAII